MKKLFTLLLGTPTRRYCLGFLVVVGLLFLFPESSFAQLALPGQGQILDEAQKEGYTALVMIVDLLSWLWIVPATLAGSLLSNTLAYGKPFFLDRYLFMMWQMMRTFSLFALGFIFLGQILKNFIKFGDPKEYFQTIKKTVLAGFLISMSWFALAALIDLSVIATSAVASVPLVVMQDRYESMQGKVTCHKKIKVKQFGTKDQLDISTEDNIKVLDLEDIMPRGDSVSGPLVFLGCAMLKLSDTTNADPNDLEWKAFLSLGLKMIINLMIILPMFVLMVVNMMRIFFIRLWAMFMPVIVLDQVFKGPLSKSESIGKYFDPKNIFGLIFQPVAVVAALSIAIILILGIYDANVGGSQADEAQSMEKSFNVYQNDEITQVGTGATGIFFVEGTILEKSTERVGGVIGELILTGFIIVILWVLVKVGFSTNEITKSTVDSMYQYGTKLMKSVPIIPTGLGAQSLGALQIGGSEVKNAISGGMQQQKAAEAANLNRVFGINDESSFSPEEIGRLTTAAGKGSGPSEQDYLKAVKGIQSKRKVPINQIRGTFQKWVRTGGNKFMNRIGYNVNIAPDAYTSSNIGSIRNVGSGGDLEASNVEIRKFFNAFMNSSETQDFTRISGGQDTIRDEYAQIN